MSNPPLDTGPRPFDFDHAVLLVDRLATAIRDFESLGFHVVAGGKHASRATTNALIGFADGSYLELLAFTHRSVGYLLRLAERVRILRRVAPSLRPYALGEGLKAIAVWTGSIEAAAESLRAQGLDWRQPRAGGRELPDGSEIRYQTAGSGHPELPSLCADVTDRRLRVPAATEHPNGVWGVRGVVIAVEDLDHSAACFAAFPDCRELRGAGPSVPGSTARHFELASVTYTLAAPTDAASSVAVHLETVGVGPFALRLGIRGPVRSGGFDPRRTHGARILLDSS